MAFTFNDAEDEVVSAINTTPLVDVMLVLLIIFLITIPVATHTAPVELPKENSQPRITQPQNINLSVDRQGGVYWNDKLLSGTEELVDRLKKITASASADTPLPEVQIHGDSEVRYSAIGKVIVACQRAGIAKVGFITEPPPRG